VFAIPQRFRSTNAILAFTALLTGTGAYWGASRYVEARASAVERRLSAEFETERIVVAAADLPAGRSLGSADMAARAVPVRFAASDRVPVGRASALAGRRLVHALRKGDPLGWSALESQELPSLSAQLTPGQRAITFPVDEVNSFSGLLAPGDSIDLLYTTQAEDRLAQVQPLLQSVRVLATGKALRRQRVRDSTGSDREVATEFVTVTLHVAPADAARIVLAQQTGALTAVLRNPADQAAISFTRLDSRALLSPLPRGTRTAAAPGAAADFLQVIFGGSGGTVAQARRVAVLHVVGPAP
jgi:pilus assembly protein CpaB